IVHLSRVVVEPNVVYFVTTAAPETRPEIVAAAEAALERVTIARGVTLDSLAPSELAHHGRVLNYTGNVLLNLGQYAEARDLYAAASVHHSGEFVTRNLAQTHYMLGAHDAVIATLDDHFEKFEANAD